MSRSQAFKRRTRELLDEHRQIHFYFDQIAATLASLDDDADDVEPLRRLAAQLEGLKERLVEHHQAEEKGGIFQAIMEAMPERRIEITRLIKQHDKMIEILEMARIHAQCGEPAEAEGLRGDLEGFLSMFRDHEEREERLLERMLESEGARDA